MIPAVAPKAPTPTIQPGAAAAQAPAANVGPATGSITPSAPTFGCIETIAAIGCGCAALPIIGTTLLVILNKIRKAIKNMGSKINGNHTDTPVGE